NRPLVAVADRETAERVLQAVAHAKTPGAEQKAVGSGQSAVGSPDGESAGSRADTLSRLPTAYRLLPTDFAPPVRLARGIRAGVAGVGEEDAARMLGSAASVVRA